MIKEIRCAIYTRKSSEEGLELEFNSLDAQREACEAFIKSQKHEGWTLIETAYDDGGYSGGTIKRPAFMRLLDDIRADKVDIVVVYKIDRLTRSLMDFSKIVEVFDEHNTSFVSITQQFNTTTSMGRLTLNMLLSFAQFEREVTSERLRDKFEASRQKGMYLHGTGPIGYKKHEKSLIEDKKTSPTVRLIFEKYIELETLSKLKEYLDENNVLNTQGHKFTITRLGQIIGNKVYIGKITYKDKVYEGLHKGIIDEEIFGKAQLILKGHQVARIATKNEDSKSLLASKLYDDNGNYMSPSHSNNGKNRKKYRYYISQAVLKNKPEAAGTITKVSAFEVEKVVRQEVTAFIKDKLNIQPLLAEHKAGTQQIILNHLDKMEVTNEMIRLFVHKITLSKGKIKFELNKKIIKTVLEKLAFEKPIIIDFKETEFITIIRDANVVQTINRGNKIVISDSADYNVTLINAIAKGFYYCKRHEMGWLTQAEKESSYVARLMSLRLLPPDVIEKILTGKQSPLLRLIDLYEMAKVWKVG